MTFSISLEQPAQADTIEDLYDRGFGPNRHSKTVYRLRDGVAPIRELCFVAGDGEARLLAAIRFWPVVVSGHRVVLLGPLAVEPALRGKGIGRALVAHGLRAARRQNYRLCLVVGEPAYYGPYGFVGADRAGLTLPGPVESRRFLVAELTPGGLRGCQGMVSRAEAVPTAGRSLRPAELNPSAVDWETAILSA